MVNTNKQQPEDDVEITNEEVDTQNDIESIESEATAQQKIKSLQTELKASQTEKSEVREELHRSKADYLNAKKRLEEESVAKEKRITKSFIEDLLPLCDSFDVAMQNTAVWEQVDEQWRKGIEGIYGQLQAILQRHNVKAEYPEGLVFDPNRHEALSEAPVSSKEQHDTIAQVVQAGYYFVDDTSTIIRPARVVVGNYDLKDGVAETTE